MIYNLVQYLKNKFPDYIFIAEGYNDNSYKECIIVSESTATINHFTDRQDIHVQILSKHYDIVKNREQIKDVFDDLLNRFGLVLPEVTVNKKVYPEVIAYQISPIQGISYLGSTNDSYHLYTFNIVVTIE